jgi:hypothetical protein
MVTEFTREGSLLRGSGAGRTLAVLDRSGGDTRRIGVAHSGSVCSVVMGAIPGLTPLARPGEVAHATGSGDEHPAVSTASRRRARGEAPGTASVVSLPVRSLGKAPRRMHRQGTLEGGDSGRVLATRVRGRGRPGLSRRLDVGKHLITFRAVLWLRVFRYRSSRAILRRSKY